MVKVNCFSIPGVDCQMYPGDHEPPHFHAERPGHWEVRVFFLEAREQMLVIMRARKAVTGRLRRALCDAAAAHKTELEAQWDELRIT